MFSKRTSRLIYFLGLITTIFALVVKLTVQGNKEFMTLLAIGNGHDSQIYLMTILPALILIVINSSNQFLPSSLLRVITLLLDALLLLWSIMLYYVLEAGAGLKTLPALYLILASIIFFTTALKTNPAIEDD